MAWDSTRSCQSPEGRPPIVAAPRASVAEGRSVSPCKPDSTISKERARSGRDIAG